MDQIFKDIEPNIQVLCEAVFMKSVHNFKCQLLVLWKTVPDGFDLK